MPIGNATIQVNTMVEKDSRTVSQSRSPTTSRTGIWYSNE